MGRKAEGELQVCSSSKRGRQARGRTCRQCGEGATGRWQQKRQAQVGRREYVCVCVCGGVGGRCRCGGVCVGRCVVCGEGVCVVGVWGVCVWWCGVWWENAGGDLNEIAQEAVRRSHPIHPESVCPFHLL